MSYVFYVSGDPEQDPSQPHGQEPSRQNRNWLRRLARRSRRDVVVRQRNPRQEAAAWLGKTAVGEVLQQLARPLTGGAVVAGVGAAVLTGVVLSALVDLTVVSTPAAATAATGYIVGLIVGFGGGGPIPALAGGLFGWLVGGIVESGFTELVKEPISRTVGVVLGWCLAAFAGWLIGRVATLMPWPWVIAGAGVVVALATRWTVSCVRTESCARALGSTGVVAARWGAVAIVWLFALVVIRRMRTLRNAAESGGEAADLRDMLRPFALLYCVWWAPLLTVAALRSISPGYTPTTRELGGFAYALLLPLWVSPIFPMVLVMVDQLMPVRPRPELVARMSGTHLVVIENRGRRTARWVTCRLDVDSTVLVQEDLPERLAPGGSYTMGLDLSASLRLTRPGWTRSSVVLTWRDGLCLLKREVRLPLTVR